MNLKRKPTRKEALNLLHKYNESDSLRKHAYAIEGVMRYIARKCNEDVEKWGIFVDLPLRLQERKE